MELPDYGGGSIANLPNTILERFGLQTRGRTLRADVELKGKIALVLLDGLGYNELARAAGADVKADSALFERITSVFPTTTAAALASLSIGLTPCQHGVVAWSFYLKEVGAVVDSLHMSPMLGERDGLHNAGYNVRALFNAPTIFADLSRAGVKSAVLLPRGLNGGISRLLYDGAETHDYISIYDAFVAAGKILRGGENALVYIYIPTIDSVLHKYGPGSEEAAEAVVETFETVKRLAGRHLASASVLITADHGHDKIEDNINLAKDGDLLSLLDVPPHGDPRAVYLRTRRGAEEVERALSKYGMSITSRREAMEGGLFGECGGRFEERIGDYIALPPRGRAALYLYKPKNEDPLKFKGHHGGLSEDELYVPLVAL